MNQVDVIKSKLNIVDIVREYVPELKKVGQNWTARSPFRSEKTPSFVVNEDKGIFKDFGGDKAGDLITFVMEMENISFQEALKICAQKAGVSLQNYSSERSSELEKLKKVVIQINTLAAEIFTYILLDHENGKPAIKYCENRGLSKDIILQYSIGYSPKYLNLEKFILKRLKLPEINWDQLPQIEIIKNSTFNPILQVSGLFANREGRWVDKFNDRLMFAIKSQTGEIVGFSGRVIGKLDNRPKYINSPETVVYKKSDILFNFFNAKNSIKKLDRVVITEGQIDTISSSKAGFPNIVAPLGTSLTSDQVKLLKRFTNNFLLCFDNDSAGQKAMDRSYEMIVEVGGSCKVISLPTEFKDIDEVVTRDPKLFEDAMNDARDFVEYKIDKNFANLRSQDNNVKMQSIKYIFGLIQLSKSQILKDSYLQILSNATGISRESLSVDFVNEQKNIHPHFHSNSKPAEDPLNSESSELNPQTIYNEKAYSQKELYLLALVYNFDELQSKVAHFPDNFFVSIPLKYFENIQEIQLNDNLSMCLSQVIIPEDFVDASKDFDFVLSQLFLEFKKREIREIKRKIMSTEGTDDDDILDHEFDNVSNILKSGNIPNKI